MQKAKEKELKKGHKFKTQTGKQPIVERGVQNNEISMGCQMSQNYIISVTECLCCCEIDKVE